MDPSPSPSPLIDPAYVADQIAHATEVMVWVGALVLFFLAAILVKLLWRAR